MDRKTKRETFRHLKEGFSFEKKIVHLYTNAAEIAKAEGANEAAEFFRNAAKDEKEHIKRIEELLMNMRG